MLGCPTPTYLAQFTIRLIVPQTQRSVQQIFKKFAPFFTSILYHPYYAVAPLLFFGFLLGLRG
jgi:hypothetical protein